MRKLAPAAFLISGILVFGGLFTALPAQADDEENDSDNSEVLVTPQPEPRVQLPKPTKEPKEQRQLKEPKELKDPAEKGNKRDQLKLKYGKEGRLSLPPLVIRPKRDTDQVAEIFEIEDDEDDSDSKVSGTASAGSATAGRGASGSISEPDVAVGDASAGFIAVNPAAKNSVVTVKSGTLVNPQQNTAIDLTNVKFTKKTPADVFIQAAQVGLYAMAAGALALSAVAVSRAIRRK